MTEDVKPPNISKKTMKEMLLFFRRTSLPRIIEDMKKQGGKQHEKPSP